MAENLFAMLQKAHESASTADAKQFGVEVGIVTNVDPSADNNAPAWAAVPASRIRARKRTPYSYLN